MSKRRNTITLKGLEKKVYDGLERFVEAWIIEQEKQVDINSLLNETCRFNAKNAASLRQSIVRKGGRKLQAIASRLDRRLPDQPALVKVRYTYSPTASGVAHKDKNADQEAQDSLILHRSLSSKSIATLKDDISLEGLENALAYMEVSQPVIVRCKSVKKNNILLGDDLPAEPIPKFVPQEITWEEELQSINDALDYWDLRWKNEQKWSSKQRQGMRRLRKRKNHKEDGEGNMELSLDIYGALELLESIYAIDQCLNSKSIDTSVLGDSEIQSEDLPEELGFNFRAQHRSYVEGTNSTVQICKRIGNPSTGASQHIFVSVNGLLGQHTDLRHVMQEVRVCYPDCIILPSMSNQGTKTLGDIQEMGQRLSDEILYYLEIQELLDFEEEASFKLSFVGFSLGNIIIRSALSQEKLRPYWENLELYLSLAGPHLGVTTNHASLLNSGMWVAKKFNHFKSIQQLTLSDSDSFERCYLYRLASARGLQAFKHIVLVTSPQDPIVPAYSATCQPSEPSVPEDLRDRVMNMARTTLTKYSIIFPETKNDRYRLKNPIGQSTHIEFLTCRLYGDLLWKSLQKHQKM